MNENNFKNVSNTSEDPWQSRDPTCYQTDKPRANKDLYLQCNNNLNFQKMLWKFFKLAWGESNCIIVSMPIA